MWIGLDKEQVVFGLRKDALILLKCTNVRELPALLHLANGASIGISRESDDYVAIMDNQAVKGPFERIATFVEYISQKNPIVTIRDFREIVAMTLQPKQED